MNFNLVYTTTPAFWVRLINKVRPVHVLVLLAAASALVLSRCHH